MTSPLNVNKTKEQIVDYRRQQKERTLIHVDGPQWRGSKVSSSSVCTT
jgi:hypothetical protein